MPKTGRKTKYNDKILERAAELAELGKTDRQIADGLKISYSVFRQYKKEHKTLAKAIEEANKEKAAHLKGIIRGVSWVLKIKNAKLPV